MGPLSPCFSNDAVLTQGEDALPRFEIRQTAPSAAKSNRKSRWAMLPISPTKPQQHFKAELGDPDVRAQASREGWEVDPNREERSDLPCKEPGPSRQFDVGPLAVDAVALGGPNLAEGPGRPHAASQPQSFSF